jgi:hypothetical protein
MPLSLDTTDIDQIRRGVRYVGCTGHRSVITEICSVVGY